MLIHYKYFNNNYLLKYDKYLGRQKKSAERKKSIKSMISLFSDQRQ